MDTRIAWAGTAIVTALLVAAALGLNALGIRSRVAAGTPATRGRAVSVVVVQRSADLVAVLRARHAHGEVLVQVAGDRLGFEPMAATSLSLGYRLPFHMLDLQSAVLEPRANLSNYLWVAAQSDFIREIDYLVPSAAYAKAVSEAMRVAPVLPRSLEFKAYGATYTTNDYGFVRRISDSLPRHDEPVILSVDASYFRAHDALELADTLKKSGLILELAVLSESQDDSNVTRTARARLHDFQRLLADVR